MHIYIFHFMSILYLLVMCNYTYICFSCTRISFSLFHVFYNQYYHSYYVIVTCSMTFTCMFTLLSSHFRGTYGYYLIVPFHILVYFRIYTLINKLLRQIKIKHNPQPHPMHYWDWKPETRQRFKIFLYGGTINQLLFLAIRQLTPTECEI